MYVKRVLHTTICLRVEHLDQNQLEEEHTHCYDLLKTTMIPNSESKRQKLIQSIKKYFTTYIDRRNGANETQRKQANLDNSSA